MFFAATVYPQKRHFEVKQSFKAPEARQGVAVDKDYIYVVGSQQIAKYDKTTHKLVNKWKGDEDGPIRHLDSGVIIDGRLYCAHSNYPDVPMTSSIEIWDAESLEHIGNHSFGIRWGSCTWADFSNGYWYAGFAHYKKWEHLTGKDASWTTVVKFDSNWNALEAWVFPKEVIDRFENMSNSGGSFGPDGLLYCTGHDAPELYVMSFPKMGSELELIEILPIENTGQGIAWDRSKLDYIYCIKKKDRQVFVSELINGK
jgi:hypothetical protein